MRGQKPKPPWHSDTSIGFILSPISRCACARVCEGEREEGARWRLQLSKAAGVRRAAGEDAEAAPALGAPQSHGPFAQG